MLRREGWRDDYNVQRQHGSLGRLTPNEFARLESEKLQQNSFQRWVMENLRRTA